jgi:hypothetical protein
VAALENAGQLVWNKHEALRMMTGVGGGDGLNGDTAPAVEELIYTIIITIMKLGGSASYANI